MAYHDREWGVPLHDDRRLFEMLILEGAQAGLSWLTILRKRDRYRAAFEGFDPVRIAAYTRSDLERLMSDPGIVRNQRKIESAVRNAKAALAVMETFGSLRSFLWGLVDHRPRQNAWKSIHEIPALTRRSERMSRALKERGFTFVGPTICYAFMQSVGMVNDHTVDCFRHAQLKTEHSAVQPSL